MVSNFIKHLPPLLRRTKVKHSDPNYAVINAIDETLKEVETKTLNSKIHSFLHSATGKYLDEWGSWFGVYRLDDERDRDYRRRIIQYIQMPRGTNQALILAVRRFFNDPTIGVKVYEPWTNIFFTNRSKLNGEDKLMGNYYRFAVIEVSIGRPFDSDLIEYMRKFLTAGVELHLNYDPSLPRTTDTTDTVATPILQLHPYSPLTEGVRITGLDRFLGGRIRLSDTKELFNEFRTNNSDLNGRDVLIGSFNTHRENLHIVGIGQDFRPNVNTQLGDILSRVEEDEEQEWGNTDHIDNDSVTLEVNRAEQLYMAFNLDQWVRNKYFGSGTVVKRTRERYAELFERSAFTMVSSANNSGHTFDFQVFNFRTRQWETLNRTVTRTENTKFSAFLDNPINYINNNRVMITRIRANRDFQLNLNYFSLDFRQDMNQN